METKVMVDTRVFLVHTKWMRDERKNKKQNVYYCTSREYHIAPRGRKKLSCYWPNPYWYDL